MNHVFNEDDFRIEGNIFDAARTVTGTLDKSIGATQQAVGQSFSGILGQFSGFFSEWKYVFIFFIIFIAGAIIIAAWMSGPSSSPAQGFPSVMPIIIPEYQMPPYQTPQSLQQISSNYPIEPKML